eukprot:40094-Prymnesium_polylepis.2
MAKRVSSNCTAVLPAGTPPSPLQPLSGPACVEQLPPRRTGGPRVHGPPRELHTPRPPGSPPPRYAPPR